jgi:hypothetical protein
MGVYLIGVYLMGVHLMGLYLTVVDLSRPELQNTSFRASWGWSLLPAARAAPNSPYGRAARGASEPALSLALLQTSPAAFPTTLSCPLSSLS